MFTCSPIDEDEPSLIKLAKRMKKINISIDFVAFGDLDPSNTKKLEVFNENIKGGDGSHLAIIPPGPSLLSDTLVSTPIVGGEQAPGGDSGVEGAPEAGGGSFDFGVDPSTDPELALALRMSMDEENARLERENQGKEEKKKPNLEGIPEEGGESKPLLDDQGQPSGEGPSQSKEDKKDEEEEPEAGERT